jgi:hypothetical protein
MPRIEEGTVWVSAALYHLSGGYQAPGMDRLS